MRANDETIWKYANKLAKQNFPVHAQRYPDVLAQFPNRRKRLRFIEGIYFVMLHQVDDLLHFITLPHNEKRFEVPILKKLRRVLKGSLFGEVKLYRVFHSSCLADVQWEDFSRSEQNRFKALYRELEVYAFHALVYWSGGYADTSVDNAFDQLLGNNSSEPTT